MGMLVRVGIFTIVGIIAIGFVFPRALRNATPLTPVSLVFHLYL